jgi:hypothetical protein
MPTPTYTPLANITLGSAANSLTFSSIPATYRDLILIIDNATTSTNQEFNFRFNSDTGSNYSYVYAASVSSGPESASGSSQTQGRLGNINTTSANHIFQVFDYSATNKHKAVLVRSNNVGASQTWMLANRWASTSAITTMRIFTGTGTNMPAGVSFSLYGIAS